MGSNVIYLSINSCCFYDLQLDEFIHHHIWKNEQTINSINQPTHFKLTDSKSFNDSGSILYFFMKYILNIEKISSTSFYHYHLPFRTTLLVGANNKTDQSYRSFSTHFSLKNEAFIDHIGTSQWWQHLAIVYCPAIIEDCHQFCCLSSLVIHFHLAYCKQTVILIFHHYCRKIDDKLMV